jgi:TetR/AcrR family fatty acid metabolism transcriptional regulator
MMEGSTRTMAWSKHPDDLSPPGAAGGADRRRRILAAAEEVLSQKGLVEATISEIAGRAQVADSVIYQYFRGKADLLFSVPGERMKEVLAELDVALAGIQDAESRLRKMVWFHLHFNDSHRGYARLLLLECRSSKDFYAHPAYRLIRRYAGILSGILEQGVKDGAFSDQVDMRLVRDVILGALDMETIGWLGSGEVEASEPDLEDLADLFHAMIAARPAPPRTRANKADAIIDAAVAVFAENGFSGAKMSGIAERAGVADGTLYEYFRSKEDLLLSIPVRRFERYFRNVSEAFEIKNPVRKLRRMIKYHFSSFLSERQFLQVFLLQIQLNARFYGSNAFESFRRYFRFIEELIEEGQAAGVFRTEVNPRVFRNVFLGAFSHMALRWLIIHQTTDTDKMDEINRVTDLLTDAVIAEDERQRTLAEEAGQKNFPGRAPAA